MGIYGTMDEENARWMHGKIRDGKLHEIEKREEELEMDGN